MLFLSRSNKTSGHFVSVFSSNIKIDYINYMYILCMYLCVSGCVSFSWSVFTAESSEATEMNLLQEMFLI